MLYRVVFIFIALQVVSLHAWSSSYEKGYESFVLEDYDKAILHFKSALDKQERQRQALYYISESYLRRSLSLLRDGSYDAAKLDLSKAKLILEASLNVASYKDEHKNYLKSLKAVNEAIYVIDNLNKDGKTNIYLLISLFIAIVLIVAIILLARKLKRRKRQPKKRIINKELTDSLEELNLNFFKTKEMLRTNKDDDFVTFIETTEDRCIMLNDKLEEASYGLRDIDEESFKCEIEDTKDTILDFLDNKELLQPH